MSFRDRLGRELILADGAMGTMLQTAGLAAGEAPTLWTMSHPKEVSAVHRAYVEAGVDFITTNTFGVGALLLTQEHYTVEELVENAVRLARTVVECKPQECYVALDIGPLGQFLEPVGELPFDEAMGLFKEQVKAGADAGADLVIIETMIDANEVKAAVLAAKEACELPVIATVSVTNTGRMLDGSNLTTVSMLMEDLAVDAWGINCSFGPVESAGYMRQLSKLTSLPLVFSPNAGLPVIKEGKTTYTMSPEEFASHMKPLVEECVAVAGGCCGTTPSHLRALVEACRE